MNRVFFAAVTAFAVSAADVQGIPAEVAQLYTQERQQEPGNYVITPKFEFPERNGLIRVDVLVSRKTEDGRWVFRNRLDRIFLKDGKIDAVRRPGAPGDFWSAALARRSSCTPTPPIRAGSCPFPNRTARRARRRREAAVRLKCALPDAICFRFRAAARCRESPRKP